MPSAPSAAKKWWRKRLTGDENTRVRDCVLGRRGTSLFRRSVGGTILVSVCCPNGESFSLGELLLSTTFGEVKKLLEAESGEAAEKQQLLVEGSARAFVDGEPIATALAGSKTIAELRLSLCIVAGEWGSLVNLRNLTGFPNWTKNKEGWATLEEHRDPNRCAGVDSDACGQITGVCLAASNLAGEIPDLSALSSLTSLNLSQNRLTGPIPESLSCCTSLTVLVSHQLHVQLVV
jgi:hypothetical protein